jgi:two-component system chemotaxis sensor kinase CheA
MVDAIRQMLQSIDATGSEGERNDEALVETLTKLKQGGLRAVIPVEQSGTVGQLVAPAAMERGEFAGAESSETRLINPATRSGASERSIRVDVILLDKLMNLVGELVLTRNQIFRISNTMEDPGLAALSRRLNLITTELQGAVMRARMQPIGNIWSKFPRRVRNLANACGKQIRIDMEGQETAVDKTIIMPSNGSSGIAMGATQVNAVSVESGLSA